MKLRTVNNSKKEYVLKAGDMITVKYGKSIPVLVVRHHASYESDEKTYFLVSLDGLLTWYTTGNGRTSEEINKYQDILTHHSHDKCIVNIED